MVNLSSRESHGLVDLETLPPGTTFDLIDRLTGARYRLSITDLHHGLYVHLRPGDAQVLTFVPV